jgi:hypothetical protein
MIRLVTLLGALYTVGAGTALHRMTKPPSVKCSRSMSGLGTLAT